MKSARAGKNTILFIQNILRSLYIAYPYILFMLTWTALNGKNVSQHFRPAEIIIPKTIIAAEPFETIVTAAVKNTLGAEMRYMLSYAEIHFKLASMTQSIHALLPRVDAGLPNILPKNIF